MKIRMNIIIARIYGILFSDLTTLRWSEGWMAFLFGTALLIYSPSSLNTHEISLNNIFPMEIWGIVFIMYGLFKLFLVIDRRNWGRVRLVCTLFGLCLWSYVFVTASLIDTFSVTDILFLMPIFAEAWFLADTLGVLNNDIRNSA